MELYGLKKESILKQVKTEHQYGYDAIQARRETKRKDLKRYIEESESEKIQINSIFTSIQTLMAIFYINRLGIEWQRRRIGDRERAKNCNRVAEFDYNEMDLDVIDYNWEFHRFMFGVGIEVSDGFDKTRIVPKIKTVTPLSWIPDPEGGPTIKSHRFAGFEIEMRKEDMLKNGWKKSDVERLGESTEQKLNRDAKKDPRNLSDGIDMTDNRIYDVYVHYMTINGKKYKAITGQDDSILLDFVYLNPILKEEKADENNVYFPIALKYYSYVDGDSYGVSVPDLLRDKQSAYSKLFNLLLITATRNALGDDKLVNTKKIKDLKGLMTPQVGGKYIPINIGDNEQISNVIATIPKDNPGQMPFNLKDMLQEQMVINSGIDRNQMGALSGGNTTKAEAELVQTNANMRFLLASKQGMWGEEFRWKYLWFKPYLANLKSVQKKEIALSNGGMTTISAFTKDEFLGDEFLSLKIVNKTEEEANKAKNRAGRLSLYPQMLEQSKSEGQRVCIMRDMMRDSGFSEDEIEEKLRFTSAELDAFQKLELIEYGDELGAEIDDMEDDHWIYIYIFQTADDSVLKNKAIARRYEAIKLQEEKKKQEELLQAQQGGEVPSQNNASNVAAAQLTNAAIQGAGTNSGVSNMSMY